MKDEYKIRTIRECIKDSLDEYESSTGYKTLPICMTEFLRVMSCILLFDAHQRLQKDVPNVSISDNTTSGKAKKEPDIMDYIAVLNQDDMIRGLQQFMQLQEFIKWFLNESEPAPGDDPEKMWYSSSFVGDKWNEYVRLKLEESK